MQQHPRQEVPFGRKEILCPSTLRHCLCVSFVSHRPFSYSRKESESNDVMMQFEEFSNVHNSDRTSNATRSNLVYKIV